MDKSLIKLIDFSLLPAALMVVGKAVGLVLTGIIFQIPISMQQLSDTFFNLRPAVAPEDLVVINTYSDIIMFVFLALGFSFILFQATKLHDTHIKPQMLIKLSNNNLMGLVRSSFDIYHQATIWLIFVWLALFAIVLNIAAAKTAVWVGLAVLIANIMFTVILLQDVYNEIDVSRRTLGSQTAF